MLFLSIISHTAADCLAHNEEVRKATFEGVSQMEELAKKHGIKIVGSWNASSKHFQVVVYDAPSYEALMAWSMEPPIERMSNYYMTDVYPVQTMEQLMQNWAQKYGLQQR